VNDDGSEHVITGIKGFGVVHVFDVSQTDGEPLAEESIAPQLLSGEAGGTLYERLSRQVAGQGYSLERGDCEGANGRTDALRRTVRVRADVDQLQATKNLWPTS